MARSAIERGCMIESNANGFTVTESQDIDATPEVVFALAGDYLNDPKWRKGVISMVYEPTGPALGCRTRERMRSGFWTAETLAEVVEYSPARTAFRALSGPIPCHGYREFVPDANGTRFTYSLTIVPRGLLRFFAPLLRTMLAGQVRKDVRRLKELAEQRQVEFGEAGASLR
jgi:hypothetical protein